jgi:hypothetical protein
LCEKISNVRLNFISNPSRFSKILEDLLVLNCFLSEDEEVEGTIRFVYLKNLVVGTFLVNFVTRYITLK